MAYPSEEVRKALAQKWLNGSLSPEEEALFNEWYDQLPPSSVEVEGQDVDAGAFKERVYRRVMTSIQTEAGKSGRHTRRWMAWSAAAAIVLAFGLGVYLTAHKSPVARLSAAGLARRIAPGGNKATLTLADGQVIYLDSMGKTRLPEQGNTQIINADDGVLAYRAMGNNTAGKTVYNTLGTPVGGQYQLQLPDGTSVWLNSASSIRYPVSFTGAVRTVTITGEAYFEVKHDARVPFEVRAGNTVIHDIGTHFDVNAYSNEPDLAVTLVEGSVEVEGTVSKTKQLMRPGEQVRIDDRGTIHTEKDFDVEKAIAWKDGLFDFDGEKLESVMRQVSRWYNVDVEYPNGIPAIQFTGSIHRNVDASQVLDMLGYFKINFKIVQQGDRKKIIVEP